jgi:hypothetical protein
MSTSTQDIVKLVKDELLPVYIKYHREHNLPTPSRVLDVVEQAGVMRERQIPALFKPPKNSY